MGRTFHVRTSQGVAGPYTATQLRALAQSGQLGPDMIVKPSDRPNEFRAGDIPGLFEDAATDAAPAAPLASGSSKRPAILIGAGVLLVAAIGVGGWFLYNSILNAGTQPASPEATVASSESAPPPQDTQPEPDEAPAQEPEDEAPPPPPPAEPDPVPPQPERDPLGAIPVSLEWEQLPEGFKGNDLRAIYEGLAETLGSLRSRDRYETPEQHHQRVEDALSTPYLEQLTTRDLIAFDTAFHPKYAPDTQEFFRPSTSWSAPTVTLELRLGEPYKATNAFGAEVEVSVAESEQIRCELRGEKDFDPVRFSMHPDEAREAESLLRAMLVGRLAAPYLRPRDTIHKEPKVDSPQELTLHSHRIPFSLEEIWVYRSDTGRIIRRFTPWTTSPSRTLDRLARALEKTHAYSSVSASPKQRTRGRSAFLELDKSGYRKYELDLEWNGSGFDITGGIMIQQGVQGSTTKTTLRPEFGLEDDEIPYDVRTAMNSLDTAYD